MGGLRGYAVGGKSLMGAGEGVVVAGTILGMGERFNVEGEV